MRASFVPVLTYDSYISLFPQEIKHFQIKSNVWFSSFFISKLIFSFYVCFASWILFIHVYRLSRVRYFEKNIFMSWNELHYIIIGNIVLLKGGRN